MSASPTAAADRRVLKIAIGGAGIGEEVDVHGPVAGAETYLWVDAGRGLLRCPAAALRLRDKDYLRSRELEPRIREMMRDCPRANEPRQWFASYAISCGKTDGLKLWSGKGEAQLRNAVLSVQRILGERLEMSGEVGDVTKSCEGYVLDCFEAALDYWETRPTRAVEERMAGRPLSLVPAIRAGERITSLDPEDEDSEGDRPAGDVLARLDDVRLSVRMMEAWCDNDEEEFLQCLAILERDGR